MPYMCNFICIYCSLMKSLLHVLSSIAVIMCCLGQFEEEIQLVMDMVIVCVDLLKLHLNRKIGNVSLGLDIYVGQSYCFGNCFMHYMSVSLASFESGWIRLMITISPD